MSYRKTEQADSDILGIFLDGAAKFGVNQAIKYEDDLFHVFDLLADNPFMARERSEIKKLVRVHPYKAHLVVYVLQDEGVLILRVLHGRQDWERSLP